MSKVVSTTLAKATALLLLLCPILQTYGWSSTSSFSVIAVSVFITFFILRYGLCNSLPKWLLIYFGYCIITYLINANGEIESYIPLNIMYPLLAYMMFFKCINLPQLYKLYKIVAAVCIAFFYVQEMSYYTTGIRIPGVLQSLPLALNLDANGYYNLITSGLRSASFFSEPAHFAQFLLPLLALMLFDKGKRNYLYISIIVLTLLLMQSGNALVGLAAIMCVYLVKIFNESNAKKKFVSIVMLIVVVIGAGSFLLSSDKGTLLLKRQDELSNNMDASSGFIRIYRGYYVFDKYDVAEQIFGVNSKVEIEKKIRQSKVENMFDEDDMYFNVVQAVLTRTGYVGALIFLVMIFSLWRKNDYRGKAILLTFVVLSFMTALYLSMTMCLYLMLAYKSRKENEKKD